MAKPTVKQQIVKRRKGDAGRIIRSIIGIAVLSSGIWLHYTKGGEVVPIVLIIVGAGMFDSRMMSDLIKAKFSSNNGGGNGISDDMGN